MSKRSLILTRIFQGAVVLGAVAYSLSQSDWSILESIKTFQNVSLKAIATPAILCSAAEYVHRNYSDLYKTAKKIQKQALEQTL